VTNFQHRRTLRGSIGSQEFYRRRILEKSGDAGFDQTAAGFSENSATPDSTAARFSEHSATPDSTAAGFSEKPATPPVLLNNSDRSSWQVQKCTFVTEAK
jgi:hypothetical protein